MGKVSKRQRKFLSKKVLPHKKKGGRRVDSKAKGGDRNNNGIPDEDQAQTLAEQRRTLPDGLDIASFLECPWLTQQACTATEVDTCVALFEPDKSWLEAQQASATATATTTGKRRKSASTGNNGGGLSEATARAMISRAVDEASTDDLLRTVWALRSAQPTPSNAATSEISGSAQGLRAIPGSKAVEVLRREGLGRLHLAFRAHLGPERDEGDSPEEWEDAVRAHRQQLEKSDAWPRLGGAMLSFLTTAFENLEAAASASSTISSPTAGSSSNATGVGGSSNSNGHSSSSNKDCEAKDPTTSLVEGLVRLADHIPLLFPFPRLARRYLVLLLGVLETSADGDSAALSLASLRMYELSTSQAMPFLHDAFKGAYRCYRGAAEHVRGGGGGVLTRARRGAGSLPMLREVFAELFGVEKPSAYLHAYVYIHELARESLAAASEVEKGGGKTREAGPALRRLRSWGFLQSLLLWTGVVAAHPSKTSLGPLVPALAKVLEIAFQLSPGLYGAPRTLALARAAQDLSAASGIFLPTSQYLVGLLELLHARESRPHPTANAVLPPNKEERGVGENGGDGVSRESGMGGAANGGGSKKGGKGGGAAAAVVDFSAVAGLGKEDLRLGEVRAAISRTATGLIAREAVCYRWSAGLPELCAGTEARLGKLLQGGCLPADGWAGKCRARVKALQAMLGKAAAEAVARRARGNKHPGEAGAIDTFRGMEESTATQRLRAFKEPF